MKRLFPFVLLVCAVVQAIGAPTAVRLESEAWEKWSRQGYDEARRLFRRAADLRLEEAKLIVVEGKKAKNDDISFEAIEDFEMEENDEFDSLLNSPEVLGKAADNKVGYYLAAAKDYEMCGLLDRAGPCYGLATAVPSQTKAGKTRVLRALGNYQRLCGQTEKSVETLRKAMAGVEEGKARDETMRGLLQTLSDTYFTAGLFKEATDTQFKILAIPPVDSKAYRDYVASLIASNEVAAAYDASERFKNRKGANSFDRSWCLLRQAEISRLRRQFGKGAELAAEALALGKDKVEAVREEFLCRLGLPDSEAAWDWLEGMAGDKMAAEHGGDSRGQRNRWTSDLMGYYGFTAYKSFRADRARKAKAYFEKRGLPPAFYSGYWLSTARTFDDLDAFPIDEKKIRFPASVADFGIPEGKTVHVKDTYLGWNPTNVTASLQEALDSGATTIVLDKMDGPWYISQVKPRSNQNIVLEKGVVVLADEKTKKREVPKLWPDLDMFLLDGVSNVVISGKGDVYVGKYKDLEERNRYCRDYGGSGFGVIASRNIAIRNMTVANCSMDGACFTGLGEHNRNIYVEDVVFDSNYRQAVSICCAENLFFKNVVFSNTQGKDPMCGIDLEPSIEVEANSGIYLFDCVFRGNVGNHLNFTSSSYYPVTLHAKRCVFEPHPSGQIVIFARCGVYMAANVQAPSRILFEDCLLKQYSDAPPVRIEQSSFFNVTFKNTRIVDVGPAPKGTGWGGFPIYFRLTRFYGRPMTYDKQGKVVFDNLQVEGYTNRPLVSFMDTAGNYSVTNIFGDAVHNGRKVDMASFRYLAPETDLKDIRPFDPARYAAPASAVASAPSSVPLRKRLRWGVQWFQHRPVYTAIYWDGAVWRTRAIEEKRDNLADLAGKPLAFYPRSAESVCMVAPCPSSKDEAPSPEGNTLYFEVPAGAGACVLRVFGNMDLVDPSGKVVDSFRWGEPVGKDGVLGAKYIAFKPTSGEAEVWGVRVLSACNLKFFEPLSGILSEKPEWLPRSKGE